MLMLNLAALICKVRHHDWVGLAGNCMVCRRCHKLGWQMP